MPPLPPWEGLHPMVVHFPVALIVLAPLFVVLAMLRSESGFRWSALLILALALGSAILAVETGEAANELVEVGPEVSAVVHEHEEGAERLPYLLGACLALYAAAVLMPRWVPKLGSRPFTLGIQWMVLALLIVSNVQLVYVGHLGARIVHEFGIRAPLTQAALRAQLSEPGPAPGGSTSSQTGDYED